MAQQSNQAQYTEENIRSLDWKEHIRLRPGMYIGKLGDGSSADDGIYVLVKEVVDNSIDEFAMGAGRTIEISVSESEVSVRDYGRGIPLGKVREVVSQMNTGAKYDSKAFQKSVGLNGVGTKAVNALSEYFRVQAIRDGMTVSAEFMRGNLRKETKPEKTQERTGTAVVFRPDPEIFPKFRFRPEFLDNLIWNYAFLNPGLTLIFNGQKFVSQDGLLDLLKRKTASEQLRYPIIHLRGDDIEVAFTHSDQYGEEHYSFVNGQHTTQGGTHQAALRESLVKTLRDFYKKDFDPSDVRAGLMAAISVRVQEPIFESQTKTKLGSTHTAPSDGISMRSFVGDFIGKELDNYLHKFPETADALQKKILQSERERKDLAGIKKLARERAKKASVYNKKLRDCRVHFDDKHERANNSMLLITEGDSASGSITKARDVETQAVFSLRGKPLNCFAMPKKVVYENEEFNLLQHALNIEEGIENLRYNQIVIATDADVDGMHIRLLLLTFFLQFFPELVKNGHLYILQTPLFRVRNRKETRYCYSEEERLAALAALGKNPEITRFKGLGEISPEEFEQFIGKDIRLDPVLLSQDTRIQDLLEYYMGKNTPQRQDFIIENLRVERDDILLSDHAVDEEAA